MNIPRHVAIIPDGNRRWAKAKGLPSFEGHRIAAEKTLPDLLKKASELGIEYFTFWAISTDNLKSRSKEEMSNLLKLLRIFLQNRLSEFKRNNVKLKVIGDLKKLPENLQKDIVNATQKTEKNTGATFILALNYGGRDELIRSIRRIYNSEFKIGGLTVEGFGAYLDTAGIPDPDLIIRTGGEKRLSGFMSWQSEYSELYFSDIYFPDFNASELKKAVEDYSSRQRRFGK